MRAHQHVVTLGLAMCVGAMLACGDDADDDDDDDDDDDIVDATVIDAALDAPTADSAPPDAALAGPVTITVLAEQGPVQGIDIVFTDPDGAVVSQAVTDALGQASEDLFAGSGVTIAVMGGGSYITITWAGVEPGDDLVWRFDPPTPTEVGALSASLPEAHAEATHYEVELGCHAANTDDPNNPVTATITSDCLGSDENIDLIALALDDSNTAVGYSASAGVPAVVDGTTSVAFDVWQSALDPFTITLANAPPGIGGAGFEPHFRIDGLDFRAAGDGGTGFVDGTGTIEGGYFQGIAIDQLQYSVFIGLGTEEAPEGIAVLLVGHPDAPASATHDLGQLLLPGISAAAMAGDDGRLSLSWTATGSFAAADGAMVMSNWAEGSSPHLAFLMLPPDATSPYLLPALPDELAVFRPSGTSTFETPMVVFAEADFAADYTAVRQDVGFNILGDRAFDTLPLTGGVMRATLGGQLPGGP